MTSCCVIPSLTILSCLDSGQTLARVGGDEFIVLAENSTQAALEATASRIIERFKLPLRNGPVEIYCSCSVGIALSPQHGVNCESLVSNADTALNHAKAAGLGQFSVFTAEMNKHVFEYLWLDTNLRKAIEQQQLVIYYQPKVDRQAKFVSAEALVRWDSPERGMMAPGKFIAYAEESGLIVPLGRWVMLHVLQQIILWRQAGMTIRVAVNVSPRQLIDQSIYSDLQDALQEANFAASPIDIELTESCMIENEALAQALMKKFQKIGAEIHLDDFGTGYSSLSQLARMPLNTLKLDQSFVRNISQLPISQSLVRAIIAVAKALNLQIVAEGVETEQEEEFLRNNGVDIFQGYRYGKPMPANAFLQWVIAQRGEMNDTNLSELSTTDNNPLN